MNQILDKIIGTYTDDNKKRVISILREIKDKYSSISNLDLKDENYFKEKTLEFKKKIQNGKSKEKVMVEALALCIRAIELKLGMHPFDTQIEAAIAMQGNTVAEMKTGEGKTLVQILSGYLNALDGNGVHICTANDYLAERDFTENSPVFEFLGLSVGLVRNNTNPIKKREAYSSDIVYSTVRNIAFDYLRDNIVKNREDRVITKPFNYAVIDEVDNTLIDEASTPIILSPDEKSTEYVDVRSKDAYMEVTNLLYTKLRGGLLTEPITPEQATATFKTNPEYDYFYCMWDKSIHIKDEYLSNELLRDAIAARHFLKEGESYTLTNKTDKNGKVMYGDNKLPLKKITIIDASTGRIAAGKKYTNGIQQAIEAKEAYLAKKNNKQYDVEFSNGLVALGICTYADFLQLYKSGVSGMTGTSSELLKDIYGLDTYQVPTRKSNVRIDNTKVYITEQEKYDAIIKQVEECYLIGRPVLIGTTSVKESKLISRLLEERNIVHNVLNAENEAFEASIIENAGQFRSVTVSTNMAGRGTDIKLSDKSRALGGLCVIGTTRNKSKRLDNQLRGRASRQGDPGSSTYYSSLEDERVIRFAGKMEFYKDVLKKQQEITEKKTGKKLEDTCIDTDAVDKAQEKDEVLTQTMIIDTIKYNEALVKQRKIIYSFRNKILDSNNIVSLIRDILTEFISEINDKKLFDKTFSKYCNINDLMNKQEVFDSIMSKIDDTSKMNNYNNIMKEHMLKIVDDYWVAQIQLLEVGKKMWMYEAYGKNDPLEYYNLKAYKLFKDMEYGVYSEIISMAINPSQDYSNTNTESFGR